MERVSLHDHIFRLASRPLPHKVNCTAGCASAWPTAPVSMPKRKIRTTFMRECSISAWPADRCELAQHPTGSFAPRKETANCFASTIGCKGFSEGLGVYCAVFSGRGRHPQAIPKESRAGGWPGSVASAMLKTRAKHPRKPQPGPKGLGFRV